MSQLDLFAVDLPSELQVRQLRRFGYMDARTGWHRLNPFRLQQRGKLAEAYDEGFRECRAEMAAE